jgi:hypothetical protein
MSELKKSKNIEGKNIGGRPQKPIWNFYNKGKLLDDSGHYEAFCKECGKLFSPGRPSQMEKHIISECEDVSETIKEAVIYIVESREKIPKTTIKTKHSNEQLTLDEYLESTVIPEKRIEAINKALVRAFICCGLPWRLIEHPFFIEFLKQLRLAYTPPNRKTISNSLLTQEIVRVDTYLYNLLKEEKNLTLGMNIIYIF